MRALSGSLHPRLVAAGECGELPEWARCGPARRAHVQRVAALLDEWARRSALGERERVRWRAAGILHDALRDATGEELRAMTDHAWPDHLLHAPAAAWRLREEGVDDLELLQAIEYHSVGHPRFAALGEFLYLADFLEPERPFQREQRAELRDRLPAERGDVLATVIALRMKRVLDKRHPMLPETLHFWNRVVER